MVQEGIAARLYLPGMLFGLWAPILAVFIEPLADLVGVKSDEVADLDVRDAPLGDEPSDVADVVTESSSQRGDVQELRDFVVVFLRGRQGCLLVSGWVSHVGDIWPQ
jgi:hypothetical protein